MTTESRWNALLSDQTYLTSVERDTYAVGRTPFERDYDKIVFSSAFRRLKDKTQVFPMPENDFVRTRLTHSFEVSCIGRTLGRTAGMGLHPIDGIPDLPQRFASIVAAACLAHDIGNPPFGHSGERAIQLWASQHVGLADDARTFTVASKREKQDLVNFEGNAQGLRVLTTLQNGRRLGGLRLTLATLGAMTKYPCSSTKGCVGSDGPVDRKKFGVFSSEVPVDGECFQKLGMTLAPDGAYFRHPLSFLVEAADDISNAVVDVADCVDQKLIKIQTAVAALRPLSERAIHVGSNQSGFQTRQEEMDWLHWGAVDALVHFCANRFIENIDGILAGRFRESLIDGESASADVAKMYAELKQITRLVYSEDIVAERERNGSNAIKGLLDVFVNALDRPDGDKEFQLLQILPAKYISADLREDSDKSEWIESIRKLSPYDKIKVVTDFVSGMTDTFAIETWQQVLST